MVNCMSRYRQLWAVLLFLALSWLLFYSIGLRQHLSLAYLQQQILSHPVGGLVLFVLLFAVGNLAQIPGWLFLAAAVLALGKLWGGVATYVAACVSCCFSFGLIRLIGGDALRALDSRLAVNLLQRLDRHPLRSVLLLRMLFQTLPALNYALAMSGIRFRHYLLGTLLGLPLPIAAYCLFFELLAGWLHIV